MVSDTLNVSRAGSIPVIFVETNTADARRSKHDGTTLKKKQGLSVL